MAARMRIGDAARRARLVARHHLGGTGRDVTGVARDLVALHSSDPATPYLALRARTPGFTTATLDAALYRRRRLWRLHAMRRTLFVAPVEAAGVVDAAVGADVARRERRKLERWVAQARPDGVGSWLAALEGRVLATMGDREWRTRELADALPELRLELTVGSGRWTARAPLASRLLHVMALDRSVVRTRPAGSWRSSQYRWASVDAWFGERPGGLEAGAARAELARRYLDAYGPATLADLCWWTGWTRRRGGEALEAAAAVAVDLDTGGEGYLSSDDPGRDGQPPDPQVAFLPALDPTPMGWKERGWFLGPHADALFDRNGNVGPSIWVGGRIVGGWGQRPDGAVAVRLLEDVGAEAAERVTLEVEALAAWLDGVVVVPRFRTPLERALAG